MNEKNNRYFFITVIIAFMLGSAIGGLCVIFNATHKLDNRGAEYNLSGERELLKRIGEYEQREKERTARENRRIEAERERIERTSAQLGAIRGLDRRSSDLFTEIEQEVKVLADFFYSIRSEYDNDVNHTNSE